MNQQATQDVSIDRGTLRVSRVFNAARPLVFSMFGPQHIGKWWGPQPYTAVVDSMDFSAGGEFNYHMLGPEGDRQFVTARFTEVTPPSRIVYENRFGDGKGGIDPSLPASLYTITFNERGAATEVVLEFAFDNADDLNTVVELGMIEGLTIGLNQLEALLAN